MSLGDQRGEGDPVELSRGSSRTLVGATVVGATGAVVAALLGLVRAKVLALELDPGGLGLYGQIFTLLMALSALTGLGLGLGTTKYVAAARARGDRRQLQLALNISLGIPIAVALLIAVAIAASSTGLAPLLLDNDRVFLILIAALAVPFVAMQGPIIHALQGFRDVAGVQIASVVFAVALTGLTALGALVAGLDGAVVAFLLSAVVYAGVLYARLVRLAGPAGVVLRVREGLSWGAVRDPAMRNMLAIGFASLTVGVAAGVGEIGVRTLVLQTFDDAAAGIYQALSMLSNQFIGVLAAAVAFFSFTTVSESEAVEDRALSARRTDDAVRLGLLLTLPLVVVVALLREQLVPLLLSSAFEPMVRELPYALAGDTLRVIAWIAGASLVPLGLTRQWVGVSVAQVLVFVGIGAWLVPTHGVRGAMIAYLVMWGFAAPATGYFLWRAQTLAVSARTLLVLGLTPGLLVLAFLGPTGVAPAVGLGTGAAALLLFVGTKRDERRALLAQLRALFRR